MYAIRGSLDDALDEDAHAIDDEPLVEIDPMVSYTEVLAFEARRKIEVR